MSALPTSPPPLKSATETSVRSPFNRRTQHDAKRAAILSEAARLFNGKGSRATTLQDVANGLGLTKTSLYYYVKTKEELIFLCYEAALQRQHQLMDAIEAQHHGPLERARAFFLLPFESWLQAQAGQEAHQAALLEIASLKPAHREHIEVEYIRMFKRLRDYLRDAIEDGSIRDCETTSTTRAIIGATDWVFHWLHQVPRPEVLSTAESAWDLILKGLATRPGRYEPESLSVASTGERATSGFDREEQNRQKQEAFHKVGTRFFNRKGFTGTSLDEIAEHLNVSKGAFYYHIRNKEDLLYACYERSIRITRRIQAGAARSEGSGLQKLDETARRIFHAQNSDEGPLIRYNTITALPPPRRREILAATGAVDQHFEAFIREGQADGSISPHNPVLARNLMTGAINASMEIKLWRRIDDIDQAAMDYFDVFYNGLLPRSSQND
jgi:AcrR family transcriptional regulator